MPNDVRTNSQFSLSSPSVSGIKNETGKNYYTETENHVSKVVEEMIEITCHEEKKPSILHIADNLSKADEQKFDSNVITGENDMPVRRSNRIRRSVVKKDEFITPRSKKNNKNSKNNEANSLKTTSELNDTDSNNNPNELVSKTNVDKSLSNKGCKSSKTEKKQKELQSSKRSEKQSDKKKPTRKKKCAKNGDISINNGDHELKKYEKLDTTPKIQVAPDYKVSGNVINTDCHKSENNILCKASDDQNFEINDKSSESCNIKPVKVKSRWWRSSELEAVKNSESVSIDNTVILSSIKTEPIDSCYTTPVQTLVPTILIKTEPNETLLVPTVKIKEEISDEPKFREKKNESTEETKPPPYDHIEENIYRFERRKCRSKKQVRRMVCDCTLTKEEQEYGILGCKEECLNRLLMIECGSRCPIGDSCSNKKFQKKEYVKTEIFKTEKKGWGLKALQGISGGDFLMEFVGEILNHREYRSRVKQYAKEKNVHSYFMALKPDEILDATNKGNHSRFINHSCNPNCETQKWTVNGELRIGVFSKRPIQVGEELTLDYQFQRYGREAQKCYCGAENCSGFIGSAKQISVDAYSGTKSLQSRKRKGSEDKKREFEDMVLEQEIEKLSGNRGLRNRDDTLKLARLMVRADDSSTRHQLLDIILKTEEQACLRLFLDYHGLPLLWSWMTDVVEFDLKAKILQVLSLLPITNKTMLLDSKVMNIVEKWYVECSAKSGLQNELCCEKSSPVIVTDDTVDLASKKLKITEFSDSETDSTSNETSSTGESLSKSNAIADSSPLEISKDNPDAEKESITISENSGNNLKQNIVEVASGLLSNWKNLKEVFRIPRLEQQKRKEDEMEVDNNAKEKVKEENPVDSSPKFGDQIQVVIIGKNVLPDHHRTFDYEQQEMKLDDSPRRYSYLRTPPVLANPRQVNKPIRRNPYPKQLDKDVTQHKVKEDISKLSSEVRSSNISPGPQMIKSVIPQPNFVEPPPVTYPPPANVSLPPPANVSLPPPANVSLPPPVNVSLPPPANVSLPPTQQLETPSSLIYPPQIMYPPSQLPFMNSAPPTLPPNTVSILPPTSAPSQPPLIQQPPLNTGLPHLNAGLPPLNPGLPPCQPISSTQPNIGGPPPNANSFLLPQNVPTSVVPGTSQFIPSHTAPMQSFPPGPNIFTNQNQPIYFMPPPTNLPNNPPPTFTENQSSAFPVQPVVSVKEEIPKPIKLPKNWRTATDSEGNVYYYHSITRHTQWDPPSEEDESDDDDEEEDSNSEESESSDTPTYDEPKIVSVKYSKKKSKKRKPTKAAADTSVAPVRPEIAKKIKELFRTKMSTFIVCCLNAYRKPSCTVGRITSNDDFKYLARKLTHYTMTKELKQCKNVEDLDCNETVMHKAKDFIKKYMAKYGAQYVRKEKGSPAD